MLDLSSRVGNVRAMRAQMQRSYYRATASPRVPQPPLQGDVAADVCIVGGGFTGVSAALELRRKGRSVTLLEAEEIGAGASGLNGGQLSGGQRRDVAWLEARFGRERAQELWRLGNEGRELVRARVAEYAIDCDLKSGVVHAVHRRRDLPETHALADELNEHYGAHLEKLDAAGIAQLLGTSTYYGGWLDVDAAHLHPLNLLIGETLAAEAAGVRVYERSRAIGYDDGARVRVRTSTGVVEAEFLVLAMNAYLGAFEPRIAGKIMPVNNYIVATTPLRPEVLARINSRGVAVADSRFVINYFRVSADGRLLFGGGESYTSRFPNDIAAFVRPHLRHVYPDLAETPIDYAWGGRLAVTMNRLPHLGRVSPHVYFAHGYSGHGIAMTHLAGRLIAEAIAGTPERFDLMASLPIRTFPGGRWLRWPGLALGMTYYALRDRF